LFALPAPTTFVSTGGAWTTASNWDVGVSPAYNPTTATSITINSNVTLSSNFELKTGTTLTINNGFTLTITGNVQFDNGSILMVQGGGHLVVNGNVINNNNSNDINVNGTITINGNFTGGVGSALGGTGSMGITGTVTTTGTGTVFGSTVDCTTPGTCNSSAQDPLPIELLYFDVKQDGTETRLTWSTASEINNDFFTIERTVDGVHFDVIGTIQGAGNSTSVLNYSIDVSPLNTISYYRLKQTDYDGKSSYSNLIMVSLDKNLDFILYPNPTHGLINLQVSSNDLSVIICDIYGRTVYSQMFLQKNIVDLTGVLPVGVYTINVTAAQKTYTRRLIIN
jgi:hypothetical protein